MSRNPAQDKGNRFYEEQIMRKSLLACFFIAALLLTSQASLYASYGLNVIENDSIGVIYFNLGKAYSVLREQVKNFDKTADANTKNQVEEMLKTMQADSPFGKDLTVAKISEALEKWHNDAVFIPTGGVWISVAKDLQPKAVIEAQIKVDKLAELVKSFPNAQGIDFTPKNNVISLRLPGIALPIEISSERIVVGSVSAIPQQLGADWQPYYKRVSSPDQHLAVELDVQTMIEKVLDLGQQRSAATSEKVCASNMRIMLAATEMYNMDNEKMLREVDMKALVADQYLKEAMVCPDGGAYSARGDLSAEGEISCSIHNTVADLKKFDGPAKPQPKIDVASQLPDPRLQHIVRARIFADTAGLLLAVAVNDEPTRQQFKEMLQQNLKMAEQQLSQNKGDARVETVKKMFAALSHVDKAPWLGVSIKQTENEQILVGTAVVGVLAAIAIPNFQKARLQARKSACFANQRVLLGATEMYNMDNAVMLSELNIETLVQKNYIKSAPVCPENGVYSNSGDLAKDGNVKCSVHGSID
jgi:competence protein ComGC